MKVQWRFTGLVVATFILLWYLKYFFAWFLFGEEGWNALDTEFRTALLNYSRMALVLLVTALLFRRNPLPLLGLRGDAGKALAAALVSMIPMAAGLGGLAGFSAQGSLSMVHKDLVMAGFFEEFLFRGFLFGLLFYHGGWGFIPSCLLPSVFFGLGHLYQAENVAESVGIFFFTLAAGAGFAWFYLAWNSLWFAVILHGCMDLAWDVFGVNTNVTGNTTVNVFRFLTLGLAVFLSVRKARSLHTYSLRGKIWLNTAR